MTYRELIELYKAGKLEEEQKKQLEADIERQEAISEYLFDMEEIPGLEDITESSNSQKQRADKEDGIKEADGRENNAIEERFLKMVRRSIRKAFLKMGICIGAVLLAVILFIMFCLPEVVDQLYYQPDKIVAEDEYSKTNQMSLDMGVYTELFLPGKFRNSVMVDSNGYGEYDITIVQNFSISGKFHNVAGKVERGDLILYDVNLLSRPSTNTFVPKGPEIEGAYFDMGPAGSQEEAYEKLHNLEEDEYYTAYITLSEVMTYTELREWLDGLEQPIGAIWYAVAEKTEEGKYYTISRIGFSYAVGGMCLSYDEEKYPLLSLLGEDVTFDEKSMQTHFVSMLRYMGDQKEFCEMIGADEYNIDWEAFAQNVEENGLNIYGIVACEKPDRLIELSEMDEISYIYTEAIQY